MTEELTEPVTPSVSLPSEEPVEQTPDAVPSIAQANPEEASPVTKTASTPADTLFAAV
ncbi:hypothetical protein [Pseudomonas fluorescens]|uniref:hypothetical protein n=1 Tax=Pseudomonas fluorescens TaxID=294 RepID=UPI0012D3F134|nr:hypothetical protein [Pseudomonas fluorescens]